MGKQSKDTSKAADVQTQAAPKSTVNAISLESSAQRNASAKPVTTGTIVIILEKDRFSHEILQTQIENESRSMQPKNDETGEGNTKLNY